MHQKGPFLTYGTSRVAESLHPLLFLFPAACDGTINAIPSRKLVRIPIGFRCSALDTQTEVTYREKEFTVLATPRGSISGSSTSELTDKRKLESYVRAGQSAIPWVNVWFVCMPVSILNDKRKRPKAGIGYCPRSLAEVNVWFLHSKHSES